MSRYRIMGMMRKYGKSCSWLYSTWIRDETSAEKYDLARRQSEKMSKYYEMTIENLDSPLVDIWDWPPL